MENESAMPKMTANFTNTIVEPALISPLPYPFLFHLELEFQVRNKHSWMYQNWSISIYITIAYILGAHLGQHFMINRKPFELRKALVVWNILLTSFSLAATSRFLPSLWHEMKTKGFSHSICETGFVFDQVISMWTWLMVLSKVTDFGDTAFVILRKKKLSTFHWMHHAIALPLSWYGYAEQFGAGRWAMTLNAFTHVFLYGYHAVRAGQIPVPSRMAPAILLLETLQLIIMLLIAVPVGIGLHTRKSFCSQIKIVPFYVGVTAYLINLWLFTEFFVSHYWYRNSKMKQKAI